jgi:hypothetical protein
MPAAAQVQAGAVGAAGHGSGALEDASSKLNSQAGAQDALQQQRHQQQQQQQLKQPQQGEGAVLSSAQQQKRQRIQLKTSSSTSVCEVQAAAADGASDGWDASDDDFM